MDFGYRCKIIYIEDKRNSRKCVCIGYEQIFCECRRVRVTAACFANANFLSIDDSNSDYSYCIINIKLFKRKNLNLILIHVIFDDYFDDEQAVFGSIQSLQKRNTNWFFTPPMVFFCSVVKNFAQLLSFCSV